MPKPKVVPVILCGGSGSRLWPLSRINFPKQFHSFNSEKSLFLETLKRAKELSEDSTIFISISEELEAQAKETLADYTNIKLLIEPKKRGTGPAICLAAMIAEQILQDSYLIILPADQYLEDTQKLKEAMRNAIDTATNSWITFGLSPSFPSTDLGYLNTITKKNSKNHIVKEFIEKPNLNLAKELFNKENIFWNSGIFFSKASYIIESFKALSPHTFMTSKKLITEAALCSSSILFDEVLFSSFNDNSVDYEILENESSIFCVPLNTTWKDLGTWNSVSELYPKDSYGNSTNTKMVALAAQDNFVYSSKDLVVISDVDDILVVESSDSLLITRKSMPSNSRKIFTHLEENNFEEVNDTRLSYRPWGKFESLHKEASMQIKILTLNPGESISLQSHKHRCENWLILEGEATVTRDNEVFTLKQHETVFIDFEQIHRLANDSNSILKILECQRGDYLEEDDIQRYEDIYNRQ